MINRKVRKERKNIIPKFTGNPMRLPSKQLEQLKRLKRLEPKSLAERLWPTMPNADVSA
jgi:hypothetical protein